MTTLTSLCFLQAPKLENSTCFLQRTLGFVRYEGSRVYLPSICCVCSPFFQTRKAVKKENVFQTEGPSSASPQLQPANVMTGDRDSDFRPHKKSCPSVWFVWLGARHLPLIIHQIDPWQCCQNFLLIRISYSSPLTRWSSRFILPKSSILLIRTSAQFYGEDLFVAMIHKLLDLRIADSRWTDTLTIRMRKRLEGARHGASHPFA